MAVRAFNNPATHLERGDSINSVATQDLEESKKNRSWKDKWRRFSTVSSIAIFFAIFVFLSFSKVVAAVVFLPLKMPILLGLGGAYITGYATYCI